MNGYAPPGALHIGITSRMNYLSQLSTTTSGPGNEGQTQQRFARPQCIILTDRRRDIGSGILQHSFSGGELLSVDDPDRFPARVFLLALSGLFVEYSIPTAFGRLVSAGLHRHDVEAGRVHRMGFGTRRWRPRLEKANHKVAAMWGRCTVPGRVERVGGEGTRVLQRV